MRILRFFSVFALCVFVAMANAAFAAVTFQADNHSYPAFSSSAQTVSGQTYPAGSIKDAKIKVATTNYVDARVDDIDGGVVTLGTNATTASTSVTANGTAIGTPASGGNAATGMFANRIDAPSGSGNIATGCGSTQICGYISANGANGTKQWVKIELAPSGN